MTSRRTLLTVVPAALLAPVVRPGAAAAAPVAPDTPAGCQLGWLLDASARVPVPVAEVRAHLSTAFLDAVGGPDGFNAVMASIGRLTLRRVESGAAGRIRAVVDARPVGKPATAYLATLSVDAAGLVSGLFFALNPPESWTELDRRLRSLAPRVSFAVTQPGRGLVHGVHAEVARPLGSAFKLYVLGALAQAVATGRATWDEPLAIRDEWKTIGSGEWHTRPAGTVLPLREYAKEMIRISDNTAADHLIHRFGREAVEAQVTRFGNRHPEANVPFLTTREVFTLKGYRYPSLARAYLALPRGRRAATLPALGRVPLTALSFGEAPRLTDRIEWFGSPLDLGRAFAGLWAQHRRPALAPVGDVLSISDGGLGLDRTRFPVVWFKGGSEPGVLTLHYLVRAADGRLLTVSLMLNDPDRAFDQNAMAAEAITLVRGAINLATP